MKQIILIGMMGAGKSTLGALLAEKLGRRFVDTDALIEQREGRSIAALFAAEGEAYFRAREREIAEELAGREELVISCGGGLPLQTESIAPLKAAGTVLWLRRDPGESYDAIEAADRPLARAGREEFLARFAQREPVYRRWADAVIEEFSSPEATLNAVLEVLQ